MTTQTLNSYYCTFCDTVANFFKSTVKETRFDSNFDHKTYRTLSQMSTRELQDIGITRGDIKHISLGGSIYRGEH